MKVKTATNTTTRPPRKPPAESWPAWTIADRWELGPGPHPDVDEDNESAVPDDAFEFQPSPDDINWWLERSTTAPDEGTPTEAPNKSPSVLPDDWPARLPGVPRGPQPRPRTSGGTGLSDEDIALATGAVG